MGQWWSLHTRWKNVQNTLVWFLKDFGRGELVIKALRPLTFGLHCTV